MSAEQAAPPRTGKWAKRLGAGAFLFFFVKGMLWLAIPIVAVVIQGCGTETPA